MSGLTSISASGSDTLQSLASMARLLRPQQVEPVRRAGPTDADGDHDGDTGGGADEITSSSAGNGLGSVLQNLASAVTAALESSATSIADANQTAESAIAAALQQTRTQEASRAESEHTAAADNDGDVEASAVSTRAADDAARTSFFKMLLDNGISPEQFRSDLLASIRNSQNGQVDRGTTFQRVPAGLTVDATA